MNVKIQRRETWVVTIPAAKEMNEADVRDWINGKAKGNVHVSEITKLFEGKYNVIVWRDLDDYPDTIKAM